MSVLALFLNKNLVDEILDAPELIAESSGLIHPIRGCESLFILSPDYRSTAESEFAVIDECYEDQACCRGLVLYSTQASALVSAGVSESLVHQCFVVNMEGVLDEGLIPGQDFVFVDAYTIREVPPKYRLFLASANRSRGDWWIMRLELSARALRILLNSSGRGYLLGAVVKADAEVSIVRCAGYLDGETDLVLCADCDCGADIEGLARF